MEVLVIFKNAKRYPVNRQKYYEQKIYRPILCIAVWYSVSFEVITEITQQIN